MMNAPFFLAALLAAWVGVAAAADKPPLRIMPLGDSITEAGGGFASYRYWLQKDLEAGGIKVDFVGSQKGVFHGEPRFADFDQDHEGHWGWTTGHVIAKIDGWAAAARPEVVLMHLGTNDLASRPNIVPENLARIIAALRKANPQVTIFVARVIPVSNFPNESLDRVNDAIEHMARRQSTAESRLIVVAQDQGFDVAGDTYDGIHPNESGEKKMAKRWAEALRSAHLR